MSNNNHVSAATRNIWMIDCGLVIGAVISFLTGFYFLILPSNGYRGGRNPFYGVEILWNRSTWSNLHMWAGIGMIALAVIHIIQHWSCIQSMTVRAIRAAAGSCRRLNTRSRLNLFVDMLAGVGFIVTALSGVFSLFMKSRRAVRFTPWLAAWDPLSVIHTAAAILMLITILVHLTLHWKWITRVTSAVFRVEALSPQRGL